MTNCNTKHRLKHFGDIVFHRSEAAFIDVPTEFLYIYFVHHHPTQITSIQLIIRHPGLFIEPFLYLCTFPTTLSPFSTWLDGICARE